MSMDLEHNNIGKKMHSENKECRVRIKNADSVCTNIGALQDVGDQYGFL
jgi:hypothetical protein